MAVYSMCPQSNQITLLQYINQLCRDGWVEELVSVGRHDGNKDFDVYINEYGKAEFDECGVDLDDPVWSYYITTYGYCGGPCVDVSDIKPDFIEDAEDDSDKYDPFEEEYERYEEWYDEDDNDEEEEY